MTDPTTAPPSASPPPRGEGLGVGGYPNNKPRPGPAPGPLTRTRATREVPGQARDGVALTIAALLLTTPALAQIIPTGTPAADILLTQAIAEHRVFLTCSSLDPTTHTNIVDNWQRDITAAAATLTENNIPPEVIAAFTTAAQPENLLPAPDTPYEDVRQICAAAGDWPTDYAQMTFTILELKLPQAFE